MTVFEILRSLCWYDYRHPEYDAEFMKENETTSCSCDNCSKGRHRLADQLLIEMGMGKGRTPICINCESPILTEVNMSRTEDGRPKHKVCVDL